MAGVIRTSEKCPKCGGAFSSIPHPVVPREQVDLVCRSCLTRPVKCWIDARGMRDRRGEAVGNVTKDPRGEPFLSFHAAHLTLSTIRQQKKDGTLDARAWQPEKTRKYVLDRLKDEYVSALLRGGRSRGHREQAERVLTELSEAVGPRDSRSIVGEDLQTLDRIYAARGISESVRKKYLQVVQAFLRWFNRYYLPHGQRIEVPPLPLIGVVRKEIGWIDTPEQETVLALIPFRELHLAYRVLFATGMRIGEVCGLKKKDLIREDGIPLVYVQRAVSQWGKVGPTKTGAWMKKPVPEDLFTQLEAAFRSKFPEDFLWLTRYGNPYRPTRLSILWHQASVEAGLNISLYAACRHSKATRRMMELQKEMWREVAGTLGDTVKITKGYVQPLEARRVKNVSGGGSNPSE